jgi:simple sugar transport system ATP-binding protein
MIELKGISKYFPSNGVMALEKADFTLQPAEIHAILGENGSGKSTLMHILAGYIHPSSGPIFVDGKKRRFSSHADALALGIGMVRQHPGFIKDFKVWEDCILGAKMQGGLFYNPVRARELVEEKAVQWHFDLPLDAKAESLTVSQRQKAAILSLLLKEIQWFIFDEPTTAISPEETKTLFELYSRLRSEGRSIVFITHKTDEALAVSNRVTVMKAGVTYSGDLLPRQSTQISKGDTLPKHLTQRCKDAKKNNSVCQPILEIKDLCFEAPGLSKLRKINFRLMPGSILGITGDWNSGLETLEKAITNSSDKADNGLKDTRHKGEIILNGKDNTAGDVLAFRDADGAYLGADRLDNNLAPELPISESLIIHACRRAKRGIFLDIPFLDSWCQKIMRMAGIARPVTNSANSFSGGMLQRILLAREFAEEASLIVLSEAGSSLSQASRAKLAEDLKEHARLGAAVLLISTDPEELHSFTEEIMVLEDGI